MAPTTNASSTMHRRGRKPKVEAGLSVCLDFLKGKCTREQCRFVHPDLTAYQQLSEAVEAQAGREICEVWAMTGQCKFGAKCNKLHPIVVASPTRQAVAISAPGLAPAPVPTPAVRSVQHVVAPAAAEARRGESPSGNPGAAAAVGPKAPDVTAGLERFAECMRNKSAPAEEEEEDYHWQPSGKALAGKELAEEEEVPQYSAARRFLQSVLGVDSALLDIIRDLNLVGC